MTETSAPALDPKEWSDALYRIIDDLKGLEPKDRLQLVTAMGRCWDAIHRSQIGWFRWFQNLTVFEKSSEETLRETFEKFRGFAINYLSFDAEMSLKLAPPPQKTEERRTLPSTFIS